MKYKAGEILVLGLLSPPSRGAWIEIPFCSCSFCG